MCVAHECRSICGDAWRPDATEDSHTICHMRCRVSLRPPRATNNSGEFFVVTEPNAGLPADYAIVGHVTAGLAVVDRIGLLGNSAQQPTMVVEIEKTTVSSSG